MIKVTCYNICVLLHKSLQLQTLQQWLKTCIMYIIASDFYHILDIYLLVWHLLTCWQVLMFLTECYWAADHGPEQSRMGCLHTKLSTETCPAPVTGSEDSHCTGLTKKQRWCLTCRWRLSSACSPSQVPSEMFVERCSKRSGEGRRHLALRVSPYSSCDVTL